MNDMEKLMLKTKKRKRLTDQLATLVTEAAQEIADAQQVGATVHVSGKTYGVVQKKSNVGYEVWLGVKECDEAGAYWSVFENREPGSSYYLHGDFGCVVNVASRDIFLHAANHMPEIIRAFVAEEDKIITALREGFESLRRLEEAADNR